MKKVLIVMALEKIPEGKYVNGKYIEATGQKLLFADGTWEIEYKDSHNEYADYVIFLNEGDEIPDINIIDGKEYSPMDGIIRKNIYWGNYEKDRIEYGYAEFDTNERRISFNAWQGQIYGNCSNSFDNACQDDLEEGTLEDLWKDIPLDVSNYELYGY